jgi:hypothetical protein
LVIGIVEKADWQLNRTERTRIAIELEDAERSSESFRANALGLRARGFLFPLGGEERVSRTLRRFYASPWKPWTLVETLDKKMGDVSKKLETPPSLEELLIRSQVRVLVGPFH